MKVYMENFEEVFRRKSKEIEETGYCQWGYRSIEEIKQMELEQKQIRQNFDFLSERVEYAVWMY